jgi:hypothetical protein
MIKYNLETLEQRRFDYTKVPPPEIKLLTIGENLILSRSNFALLTGAPKVGKSTFTSVILASAIARHPIFDIQLHRHEDKKRIALFDTEQANLDLYKAVDRVIQLSGFKNQKPDTLDVFTLRKDDAPTIIKLIEFYLQNTPDCGVIFIDGLLDLVYNFNDEKECKMLIDFLKRVTAEYNIGIVAVLHTGKTSGQTVGHIGSFADRYCQSNLEITKEIKKKTIDLKGKLLRSAGDFEPISLMRDGDGKLFQVTYWEEQEPVNMKKSKK